MAWEEEAARAASGVSGQTHVKALEDLLVTLRRSSKDLAFYPPEHPLLKASLEKAVSRLRTTLGTRGSLPISVSRAGFSFEGRPVGQENRQLAAMAGELFARRIQQILFLQDVGMEDLGAFLQMITSDPKHLLQQGGPTKVLAGRGVLRIQVTEMDFRRLSEAKDAAARPADSAEKAREKGTHPEATGQLLPLSKRDQEDSSVETVLPALASQSEPTVEALIRRLEQEAASGTPAGYEWTASRLETAAGRAVSEDRLKDTVAILWVFLQHRQANTLGAPLRERAAKAVETIAAGNTVPYLVDHLRTEAGASAEDLAAVLIGLGGRVIPPLLGLATGDQGAVRGRLVAILARLSEVAQAELSRALRGADRDQACYLAPILGEIGGEVGVALLGSLFRHQDVRVRREVVRQVGRIRETSAQRLLLQALRDPEPAVLELAVGLVGSARVKPAIPTLLRLAGQRVLAGRPFVVRKSAVTALGAIGDPGSVSTLAGVLRTRTWFKRAAGNQLRLAAAQALLFMARPEAREVVEAGARSRRGDVRRACAAALQTLATPAPTEE